MSVDGAVPYVLKPASPLLAARHERRVTVSLVLYSCRLLDAEFSCIVVCRPIDAVEQKSCIEEEIPEQPDQSAALRSAKRDRVRRRRSCETEEQTVARRTTHFLTLCSIKPIVPYTNMCTVFFR